MHAVFMSMTTASRNGGGGGGGGDALLPCGVWETRIDR